MELIEPEAIRNIALIGQGGSGKTSLADAILWVAKMVDRQGKVERGTSVFDYEEDEKQRQHSINLAVGYCNWRGCLINIIDTPGGIDFVGDAYAALRVVDGAVLVLDASGSVEFQAERLWVKAREYGLARLVFVTKLDSERADFESLLSQAKERLKTRLILLTLPIGERSKFNGVVDIISQKAFTFTERGEPIECEIPEEISEKVAKHREQIVEVAAESSDELLEKYIEGQELSDAEIKQGLLDVISSGSAVPVLCGSSSNCVGISLLLDYIVDFVPSPAMRPAIEAKAPGDGEVIRLTPNQNEPLAALVFKTVTDPYVGRINYFCVFSGTISSDSVVFNANEGRRERIGQLFIPQGKNIESVGIVRAGQIGAVAKLEVTRTGHTLCDETRPLLLPPIEFPTPVMEMAIHPKTRGDEDKLLSGLQRLQEEDGSFKWYRNNETGETIIAGLGDLHLEVAVERLKRKFGADVEVTLPKIPYKETIRKKGRSEGRYIRQTGGRGQYGVVWLEVEPLERGEGYEFVDAIVGGVIPSKFIPSVEKGVIEAMQQGVLAGYPVVDVKVTLFDGKHHEVDSSDIAFKNAGIIAFRNAMAQCEPYLLEPIMEVEIIVPEENMGDIIGDLNGKRGKILGMESINGMQKIHALVPLAEMQRYATTLRSLTRGRGQYTMRFSHYEEVPTHLAEKIIAEARKKTSD
ncbi:MAG: elongation factor G [Armatimonadota bacterium]|nr:elongation factor G [Armatimonadota bacterium]MCX7776923.1 elongation factor G [Armatimonadota bacterium]MDW8024756.1 elongation factor G [Armatimonadota bacterium]